MYFALIIIGICLLRFNITKDPNRTFHNLDIAGIDYIAIDVLEYWD